MSISGTPKAIDPEESHSLLNPAEGSGYGAMEESGGHKHEEEEMTFGVVDEQVNESGRHANSEDFRVMVHVIEARDLHPRDSNLMSDPVVKVECLGETKSTKIQKKTLSPLFDTLFSFEATIPRTEFEVANVRFAVYDADTFSRNELIGEYSVDVAMPYSKPTREIRNWLALSAPGEEGIQGYLKVAILALGPGDDVESTIGEDLGDDTESDADLQAMLLMPPDIDVEGRNLVVNVYRVENLPKTDQMGKCDPYIKLSFAGYSQQTSVKEKSYAATYNEALRVPASLPSLSDVIDISLWDKDTASRDDCLGHVYLSYADYLEAPSGPFWVNFYVDPIPERSDPAYATKYNGRVLVAVHSELSQEPGSGVGACAPLENEPAIGSYAIRLDTFQGVCLPTSNKVKLEVKVYNDFSVIGDPTKTDDGQSNVYESLDDLELSLPLDPRSMPRVFVWVHHKDGLLGYDKLGFITFEAADLLEREEVHAEWHTLTPMKPDPEKLAGSFLLRIWLGPTAGMPQRVPIEEPEKKKHQLRVHLYAARGLRAGDDDSFSDPYVLVQLGSKTAKSSVVKKSTAPVWNETVFVNSMIVTDFEFAPRANILVYDHDTVTGNDLLGRVEIPLQAVGHGPEDMGIPQWYPLYMFDPSVTEGEVLMSLQVMRKFEAEKCPMPELAPETLPAVVEIGVVGLRNLQSSSILGVRSALVQVDHGTKESVQRTETSTSPSRDSPNYLTTLTLNMMLPVNPLFAPTLNVSAIDRVLGMDKFIGAAQVDLAPYMPWSEEEVPVDVIDDRPTAVDNIPGALPGTDADSADAAGVGGGDVVIEMDMEPGRTLEEVPDAELVGGEDIPEPKKDEEAPREVLNCDLEATLTDMLFREYTLRRVAKVKRTGSKWKGGSTKTMELVSVGQVKLSIRIKEAPQPAADEGAGVVAESAVPTGEDADPPLDLVSLFAPQKVVVRAYILRGLQLVPQDGGTADPYIKINYGKNKKIDERDHRQHATLRPKFMTCLEMEMELPSDSELDISLWDYDSVSRDDLIGHTVIDLENRAFSPAWQAMEKKPIERRALWSPSSTNAQGKLELWIEVLTPEEARNTPPTPLGDEAEAPYELRVIVWNTRNVKFRDDKMSDIRVSGLVQGHDRQVTDTHWRSENGEGAFNWRMKFPMNLPTDFPRLRIQLWDNDVFNPDDAVCEANLNLAGFLKKALKHDQYPEGLALEQQWVHMFHPSFGNEVQGEVELSVEILPKHVADARPAGLGREDPNQNPHLADPVRPDSSFAPWRVDKYTKQFFWNNRYYFLAALIGALLVLALVIFLWIKLNSKKVQKAKEALSGDTTTSTTSGSSRLVNGYAYNPHRGGHGWFW